MNQITKQSKETTMEKVAIKPTEPTEPTAPAQKNEHAANKDV